MKLTTGDILKALGNETGLLGSQQERTFDSFSSDTRKISDGALFVAIRGERFDGNAFLQNAADSGASGALVSAGADFEHLPENFQCFAVEDTVKALGRLAEYTIENSPELKVAAITGSNGKSTTKEIAASVLRQKFSVHSTCGNFNNNIGLPLTVLGLDKALHEVLVLEIGANHPGEVANLAKLVKPQVAAITTVAPSHLEGFGSIEGVLNAKLELFDNARPGAKLCYNGDNAHLKKAVPTRFSNTVSFGIEKSNDIRAERITTDSNGSIRFALLPYGVEINLPMLGKHNVYNALAAASIGVSFGLDANAVAAGIESAKGMPRRLQIRKIGTVRVLDDSYNSNPESARAALDTFCAIDHHGSRIAVIGDMLEMGESSESEHKKLGEHAAGLDIEMVIFVGGMAASMESGFLEAEGDRERVITTPDRDAAWSILDKMLGTGDFLLVKASLGVGLDLIIKNLERKSA